MRLRAFKPAYEIGVRNSSLSRAKPARDLEFRTHEGTASEPFINCSHFVIDRRVGKHTTYIRRLPAPEQHFAHNCKLFMFILNKKGHIHFMTFVVALIYFMKYTNSFLFCLFLLSDSFCSHFFPIAALHAFHIGSRP